MDNLKTRAGQKKILPTSSPSRKKKDLGTKPENDRLVAFSLSVSLSFFLFLFSPPLPFFSDPILSPHFLAYFLKKNFSIFFYFGLPIKNFDLGFLGFVSKRKFLLLAADIESNFYFWCGHQLAVRSKSPIKALSTV